MSTGVAFALPLAGVGGFNVTASEVTAEEMILVPGVDDTDTEQNFPQTVVQLTNAELQQFTLTKDMDLDRVSGFPMPGTVRVRFASPGQTDGGNVMVKSSALQAEQATFNDFVTNDTNATDARGRWRIQSNGPVTLQGADRNGVQIRAHYLLADRISISDLQFVTCYDPDSDGNFEWGPCRDASAGDGDTGGNAEPTADATSSEETVSVGDSVTFNGSASSDPDGSITSYEWSFGDGASATGAVVSHTYDEPGAYTARLTVTDDSGAESIDSVTVFVEGNEAPIASPSASATTVEPDQSITFDGSGSSDPDGTIESYEWDFDDGSTATGQQVSHSYAEDGTYDATLTVTDDDGATASGSVSITVQGEDSLIAAASASPQETMTGDPVTFDGSNSVAENGSIESYEWDFGDGSTATGQQVTHTYASGGEFTATLTVTDDSGQTATDTVTVTVTDNDPPTADASVGSTVVEVGESVAFQGSNSSDPDGTIESYEWEFGDGATATGSYTSHAYSSPGEYTATLTVTDDDGATDSQSVTITVDDNDAPTAVASVSPTEAEPGESFSFDASDSSDPDGSIASYEWDFGDGSTATGQQVSHSYDSEGEFTATLTVTDDDGATATDTVTVTTSCDWWDLLCG
ncbi:PKD domain-containing protein [Halorientalis halophila]|uniref:PKD domain-containing protein n=1 Tax=Halorientalis halophila TaxID=3108499 RepID=UPI00300B72F5